MPCLHAPCNCCIVPSTFALSCIVQSTEGAEVTGVFRTTFIADSRVKLHKQTIDYVTIACHLCCYKKNACCFISVAVRGPTLVVSQGCVHAEELHALVHHLHQQPVSYTRTGQGALVGHQPHSIRHIPQGAACTSTTNHSGTGDCVAAEHGPQCNSLGFRL